jgi:uncharacterized protein
MSHYLSGCPCWVDLGSPRPSVATDFYAALFGWDVEMPDDDGYRLCRLGGRLVAALGPGSDEGAPYWTLNVSVDDLDAAVAAVEREGGHLTGGPGSAGGFGRFAATVDVMGSPVSLWEPGVHAGAELVGVEGSWVHTELVSDRPGPARAFYRSVFGWADRPLSSGEATGWDLGGTTVATLRPPPTEWVSDRASLWTIYFGVADVEGATEEVVRLGGTFICAFAIDDPAVLVTDSQGSIFGLRQVHSP